MRGPNRISVASVSKSNLLLWHVRRSNSSPRKKEKKQLLEKRNNIKLQLRKWEGEWKQISHSSIIQIYEFMAGAERERERDCGRNESCCYSSTVAL